AQGRFRVSLFSPIPDGPKTQQRGEHVAAFAYPPEGEPYLTGTANLHFPKGVVRREVEIALPPAVLVRGKITEAGSGKPVAGAYLECPGYWNVRVRSGPDGSCQMGVPEGTKRLLVIHPSGDYIPQAIGSAEMLAGKPGGDRVYFDG